MYIEEDNMISLINWEEVAERLKKISEDKSKIYNLVENEIIKTLKEMICDGIGSGSIRQ